MKPAVQVFWSDYRASTKVNGQPYDVFGFGDSPELMDELAALVLAGTKRATTGLLRWYTEPGKVLPKAGDLCIILDSSETPCCVIRLLRVDVKPICEVDASFAWDEGEDDRTLAQWMAGHMRYFHREAAREGFVMDDSTEVVLQRFEVVWPPEFADHT